MEIHFTPEQEAQLSEIASRSGIDAEQLVKRIAMGLLKRHARFQAAVQEGIDQADRGELIEEDEVDARIDWTLQA